MFRIKLLNHQTKLINKYKSFFNKKKYDNIIVFSLKKNLVFIYSQ